MDNHQAEDFTSSHTLSARHSHWNRVWLQKLYKCSVKHSPHQDANYISPRFLYLKSYQRKYNFLKVLKYEEILNQNQIPTTDKSSLDLDSGNDGREP